MPVTVFAIKGVPDAHRERIEAAVVEGGKRSSALHEAWISTDPRGTVRVFMTGPDGFERSFGFGLDENPAIIAEMVREALA